MITSMYRDWHGSPPAKCSGVCASSGASPRAGLIARFARISRSARAALLALCCCLFSTPSHAQNESSAGVQWLRSAHAAAEQAEATGKPILIYVRSKSCTFCDKMQAEVWENPSTAKLVMREFVPLKLTREENQEAVKAMQVSGFPSTLLFSPERKYLGRLDGYLPNERFLSSVSTLRAAGSFESVSR